MARFVISEHVMGKQRHWDLMLEAEGVLATWQVPEAPGLWAQSRLECRKLPDHRLKYLDYEGPISGSRGTVRIAASGEYDRQQVTEDCWRVSLRSEAISGTLLLHRQVGDCWRLGFESEVEVDQQQ